MAWERLKNYFQQSRSLSNSLVTVLPLLIFYQLGILLVSRQSVNGVDFLTIITWRAAGVTGLVIANLILVILFLVGMLLLRRKQSFRTDYVLPMIVESAVWAVGMGVLIVLLLKFTLPVTVSGGGVPDIRARAPLVKIIASIGAGVNEELVFRLALMSFIIWFCATMFRLKKFTSVLVGILLSSLLFSLAHYFIGGERFAEYSFFYRLLAGIIFALIFKFRGFAIAVYTHTIYDLFVLFAG